MSMQSSHYLKKSGTHSFALPKLAGNSNSRYHNYNTSRVSQLNRSTFLQRVQPITKNVEYREMDSKSINDEHKNLKHLLRDFNAETYEILGKYIDKPLEPSRKKSKTSNHTVIQIREKECENNTTILQVCQKELQKLQERSNNLKYATLDEYENKIQQMEEEIEQVKSVIKQIKRQNTLRGQEIKKDEINPYNEVSDLQLQIHIQELKKRRLNGETKYANDEQEKLKQKTEKTDLKVKEMQEEYSKITKEKEIEKDRKKIQEEIEQKKRVYKSRKEYGNNSKYEYTYLRHLKELDKLTKNCKKAEEDTQIKQEEIEQSKRELLVMQQRYSTLKKKEPKQINKQQK